MSIEFKQCWYIPEIECADTKCYKCNTILNLIRDQDNQIKHLNKIIKHKDEKIQSLTNNIYVP